MSEPIDSFAIITAGSNKEMTTVHDRMPVFLEPDQFDAIFELDKIVFRRRDNDIETELEITVSSEDDVEVRRLTIGNRSQQTRELEVTSFVEMVLGRPEDDLAHPAFGKLSPRAWGVLAWRHTDHHLRQFGV